VFTQLRAFRAMFDPYFARPALVISRRERPVVPAAGAAFFPAGAAPREAYCSDVAQPSPKVVIVNGSIDLLIEFGALLDGLGHDIVFVDSAGLAYGQIKCVRPDLIIVCATETDLDSLRVMSMLKADDETRSIPMLTYFVEDAGDEDADEALDFVARMAARAKWPVRMH
jgi:CheY-like chemotaxis protein